VTLLRRLALRWLWSKVPMPGWAAPYVLGFALNSRPRRVT